MQTETVNLTTLSTLPKVDILLATAVPVERDAMLAHFQGLRDGDLVKKIPWGEQVYYLGRCGQYTCALVLSEQGATGQGGSLLVIDTAIERFLPHAVIMVGVAFGKEKKKKKQILGDVLVSTRLVFYAPERIGPAERISRAPLPDCGATLLSRARNLTWNSIDPDTNEPRPAQLGPILSGPNLVDNPDFKQELFRRYPDAIGGEMEGEGLYAASHLKRVEWIMVKGICDWADGNKKKLPKAIFQRRAAENASSFVAALLSEPGLENTHFVQTGPVPHPGQMVALDSAVKEMALAPIASRIRDTYRIRQEKSEALEAFIRQFPVKDNKPQVPHADKARLHGLMLARQTALEDWLNAYNDACAKYIGNAVDRNVFLHSYKNEISEIFGDPLVSSRLHPRERSAYGALWQVYEELNKEQSKTGNTVISVSNSSIKGDIVGGNKY